MQQQKSDAYAIVSLALALVSISDLFYFFRFASDVSNAVDLFEYFSVPAVAIIFGIIGLKSSARKVSIAGIAISVIDVIVKSTFSFVLPIVGIILKGPG